MTDPLRLAAELVYAGENLAAAERIDCTTTCPRCGHGEAIWGPRAPAGGYFETCLACGLDYIDPAP